MVISVAHQFMVRRDMAGSAEVDNLRAVLSDQQGPVRNEVAARECALEELRPVSKGFLVSREMSDN